MRTLVAFVVAIATWCPWTPIGAQEAASRDAAVATEIEHRFSADRAINAQTVDIHVRDGVVVLTGRVSNEDAKTHAAKLASAVDGVEKVDNRLSAGLGGRSTADGASDIPERVPGDE